ncbi:MAG: DNA-directed RNA polymerase subunit N [Candidatus Micrarchaeota archaeon]
MMIPVRCFTCGKPVAEDIDEFVMKTQHEKQDSAKVLNELGYNRYCCRRMFLSYVPLIDEIKHFPRF